MHQNTKTRRNRVAQVPSFPKADTGLAPGRGERCGLEQGGRRDGEGLRARWHPSPLRSWCQAFKGARHSADLPLVMIYSTVAVAENILGGLLSEDPACRRTLSAASGHRPELHSTLGQRHEGQTLAHFTEDHARPAR